MGEQCFCLNTIIFILDILKELCRKSGIIYIADNNIEICIFGMVQIVDFTALHDAEFLAKFRYISCFREYNACLITIAFFEQYGKSFRGLLCLNQLSSYEIRQFFGRKRCRTT